MEVLPVCLGSGQDDHRPRLHICKIYDTSAYFAGFLLVKRFFEMKIETLVLERTSPQAKIDRFSFIWLFLIAEEYLKMSPRQ